jgi:hypothetical protein
MSSSMWRPAATLTDRPPIAGWLIGVVLGLGFSWMPCRWINHATYNSRAILPAFEAMAAGRPEVAIKLLKEVEDRVVFNRLFESPELREGIRGLVTAIPDLFSPRPAIGREEL